ncbi:MAG: VOC family protein [Candidatus Eremiobacteraeota bacterium]|nr:VOC family protein [Candidatus Eremiobacteraeota bacterium]
MSHRSEYPSGVPCWVDTLQPDPRAATQFYGALFGWDFAGPGGMPDGGEYYVARMRGLDVAGVGSTPKQNAGPSAFWNTYVAVDDVAATCEKVHAAGGSAVAGPIDALPAGRLAVVTDPAGAAFCLWEARERPGAQVVNESAAWSMSALIAADAERAARFYAEVFGWQTAPFSAGGATLTLLRRPGYVGGEPAQPVPRDVVAVMLPTGGEYPAGTPAHWSVAFWILDVDAAAATAASAGATLVAPPHDTPGFRRAIIRDPQGAVFTLSQIPRS